MQGFYLDLETHTLKKEIDTTVNDIITIQYQPINLATGKPEGDLVILNAWESS
jgi:hypothetical protein